MTERNRRKLLHPDARRWCLAAAAASGLPLLLLLQPWLAMVLVATGALALVSGLRQPWPAWLRVLLTMSLAGLVLASHGFRFGRDTGCALLLAMLALKLGETRWLRDGRSLVGFGLFACFAAFLQDQGPLTLALALPAAALALAASARMSETEAGIESAQRPMRRLGRSLAWLALALPIALAGFWLFPRLGTPMWGVPENALAKTGISDSMSPGDWLDLMVDDAPAFRAHFSGPSPSADALYWRGPVLVDFDGRTWTHPGWTSALPPADAESLGPALDHEIILEPTDKPFLFALDVPASVPDGARMGLDRSLYSRRAVGSLRRYGATSIAPVRFEPELRRTLRQNALRLPAGFNPRTLALARQWRSEGADDAAIIGRALDWIRAEFTYSLDAPLLGRDSVDEFLFETRIGFCEHYSSAFAVLMRAAGIPTRVVTGYLGGFRNPVGDYWLVRQSDAHAWNEVWLEGRGWVRVDPTAAVAPERVLERSSRIGSGLGAFGQGLAPIASVADWLRRGWNEFALGFDAARQRLILRPFGIDDAERWHLLLAFILAATLILAASLLLLARSKAPPPDRVVRAWNRFAGRLARAGVPPLAFEPPLAYGRRAAARLPGDAAAISALSGRFSRWRYAEVEQCDATRDALVRDLRAFRASGRAPHPTGDPA